MKISELSLLLLLSLPAQADMFLEQQNGNIYNATSGETYLRSKNGSYWNAQSPGEYVQRNGPNLYNPQTGTTCRETQSGTVSCTDGSWISRSPGGWQSWGR